MRPCQFPDLSGQRFGRLLALDYAGRIYDNSNSEAWRCQCDCGALTVVLASSLRYGLTRSCGCLRRERARRPGYVEDLQGHRFGFNPNSPRFATHGGLGVVVSEAWGDDYAAFRFWARANGYREGFSLVRVDAMVTTRPAIASGCRIVTGSGTAVSIGWSAAATTASSRP